MAYSLKSATPQPAAVTS